MQFCDLKFKSMSEISYPQAHFSDSCVRIAHHLLPCREWVEVVQEHRDDMGTFYSIYLQPRQFCNGAETSAQFTGKDPLMTIVLFTEIVKAGRSREELVSFAATTKDED